jgi:hypothetical protein
VSTVPHTSWPPRPPIEDIGPNGAPLELRCYLPESRRRRSPVTMPVVTLAVLVVAALLLFLFYRIST